MEYNCDDPAAQSRDSQLEQIKNTIVGVVTRLQGCKATELVCDEEIMLYRI